MNKASAWQRYVEAASGIGNVTQKRAEQAVKALVKQGELAAERAEKAVDDLLKRSEDNRKALTNLVRAETEKAVGRLGVARQRDIERLERKVAKLEKEVSGRSGTGAKKASGKKSSAKKAKKASGKTTAKKAKKTTPGSSA